ncbi:hypothetical protein, partial [Arthrobacter oryzae]|uniref:hypothetical protein n=1 Tax=Arthrobacter oryzae TaxID=409290 RepID=UPI001C82B179
MMLVDGRWFVAAAGGRLFSVFGQSGVACWFAWVGAGSTSGDGGCSLGQDEVHDQPVEGTSPLLRRAVFSRSSFRRSFSGAV